MNEDGKRIQGIINTANNIVGWIKTVVTTAGARGCVVGVSGGVDSALVLGLCQRVFPQTTIPVIMPCYSTEEDLNHADMVCSTFKLEPIVFDLSSTYSRLMENAEVLGIFTGKDERTINLTRGNLKARLRMCTLYMIAQLNNSLVIGTDNAAEYLTGYFTKYGDGGVDMLPISILLKRQVREMAEFIGVPMEVIAKPPSAGLWPNQTDEEEMQLRYDDIDAFIEDKGWLPEGVKNRIEVMARVSQHKRCPPPSPPKEFNEML
ncbi:MAG: NAD(+) synthase [Mahellales bacterium]|jgi:NAD+ synthase